MPPKTAPGKNAPTNNPPPRGAQSKNPSTRGVKGGAGKKAKEKGKGRRLKLKGWLETKADWAKFDAWAMIKAQPRKIPEPEPVVRVSKPLSKLKKRIAILSKPQEKPDIGKTCRTDLRVSQKALNAKPSKRIMELAKFVVKNIEPCREMPIKISRAALRYQPTERIIEISRPRYLIYFSEYCKVLATSQDTNKEMTVGAKRLALTKKAIKCQDLMTDEEMNIIMTPTGIYRSALSYKFTPWMAYLALPSYRFLKDQTDEQAEEWKKIILEEGETRGKEALEYKKKKREKEKEKKREEDAKRLEEKEDDAKTVAKEQPNAADIEEQDTAPDENSEEQANESVDGTGETAEDSATNDDKENYEEIGQEAEAGDSTNQNEKTAEEEEAAKQRKAERNAWRYAPPPCNDDPFEIKRSALKGKVSPRMDELAIPHVHEDRSCRNKPFEVRKSALNGPIPERMIELAKPNHPLHPVERSPPRDKDSFGRPIFPIAPYGKKMPRMKPYQEAECPVKDDEEEIKKKEEKKRRFIDPIVYEATIDPCIDPGRAKRQLKARKAAKEEFERRKAEEDAAKEIEPQEPDTIY